MPLTPNFTVTQNLGTPNNLTFIDSSTGSDVDVVGRKISLLKSDGSYIIQNYTWALASVSLTISDVLNRDYGLYVTVNWVNVSGNVLYSKSYPMLFVANVDNFINGLTQQETALPNIVGGANYWSSKAKIMGLVEDATQAVIMGGDYKKAQTFLNATLEMMNNQTNYF